MHRFYIYILLLISLPFSIVYGRGFEELLIKEAGNGNITLVKNLVEKQNVSPKSKNGAAFIAACEKGNLDVVKYLYERGVDLKVRKGEGFIKAAGNGHRNVVQWFINKKIPVEIRDGRAVVEAAKNGQLEVLKFFSEELEVDLNKVSNGRLLYEVVRSSVENHQVIKYLLENGVNPNGFGGLAFYNVALKYNESEKWQETFDLFIEKGADVNVQGGLLLIQAVSVGDKELLDKLIKSDARLDIKDCRALRDAIAHEHYEIVKQILDDEVGLKCLDNRALAEAIDAGDEKVLNEVLTAKGRIDINKDDGKALVSAIKQSKPVSVLEMLLENDADPNARNSWVDKKDGQECGIFWDIFYWILRKECSRSGVDKVETALISAVENGNVDAADLLKKYGVDIRKEGGEALVAAVLERHTVMIPWLAASGVNLDYDNGKALIKAIDKGFLDAVEMLLKHGAKPNVNEGEPLVKAVILGNEAIVELLLKYGADPTLKNNEAINQAEDWGCEKIREILKTKVEKIEQCNHVGLISSFWKSIGYPEKIPDICKDAENKKEL